MLADPVDSDRATLNTVSIPPPYSLEQVDEATEPPSSPVSDEDDDWWAIQVSPDIQVANVLQRVLDRAIQTHGALGLTDATPLAFWWGHERGARIYDGADEVHKSTLARRILERHGMTKEKTE